MIVSAGGTAPTDPLLISLFDNSLPNSYSMMRQLVRGQGHAVLVDHVADYMARVKAELASRSSVPGAFVTQVHDDAATTDLSPGNSTLSPQLYDAGGGRGKGKGGKGRGGKGGKGGKGNNNGLPALSICLRCLLANHTRPKCNKPKVQCQYCGADHHHSLCFHQTAPGSDKRNNLSEGAKNLLHWERVQRAEAHDQRPALVHLWAGPN